MKRGKKADFSCWRELLVFPVFCPTSSSCHGFYGNRFRRVELYLYLREDSLIRVVETLQGNLLKAFFPRSIFGTAWLL
jgi:hypothetical protein